MPQFSFYKFEKSISPLYNSENISIFLLPSGPSKAEISGVDDKIATVKKLQEGRYVFKLTVTDDRGLTATDIVAVSVKKGKGEFTPLALMWLRYLEEGKQLMAAHVV